MADATFGCTVPTSGRGADPVALRDVAQAAEALGYDAVWVSDHLVIPARIGSPYPYSADGTFRLGLTAPYLEPLAALAYLAGPTKRIRLGTHVLILPYRNPMACSAAGRVSARTKSSHVHSPWWTSHGSGTPRSRNIILL